MARVALIKCNSYDYSAVKAGIERGLTLIGGIEQLVKPGERILLKPNLLAAEPPEKCVTTHPVVFKAVAELLQAAGVQLFYGDSPGFGSPASVARKSGIAAAADELGIPLAEFTQGEEIHCPEGIQNKRFVLAQGVIDADGLVSLPKLKTHGLMRLTGAIKNQFGCVPGVLKGEYHVKLPEVNSFAQMLVDLNLAIRPRLFIMDGIMAMEGNGPRGGSPIPMNVLLLSTDPVALDTVVCRLVGLDPEYIPTLRLGEDSGLGTMTDIEVVGDNLTGLVNHSFGVKHEPAAGIKVPGIKFFNNILVPRPYIIEDNCVRCGICVQSCPVQPKAVDWETKKQPFSSYQYCVRHCRIEPKTIEWADEERPTPVYYYQRCIRCFCCQEMCPEQAIAIHNPWLRRLLNHLMP